VTLFRLIRASGGGRRAGQRHLTPLVGRDEEIAMLMRRWERVRQGDGQLVLIVGEPGLGKSRLIEEFHTRLRDEPHTWVEWSCSQLLQNTPLACRTSGRPSNSALYSARKMRIIRAVVQPTRRKMQAKQHLHSRITQGRKTSSCSGTPAEYRLPQTGAPHAIRSRQVDRHCTVQPLRPAGCDHGPTRLPSRLPRLPWSRDGAAAFGGITAARSARWRGSS
jgi:AAA ATPase domain